MKMTRKTQWRHKHPIKAKRYSRKWSAEHPYADWPEEKKQRNRDAGARYRATPNGRAKEKRRHAGAKGKLYRRRNHLKHRYGVSLAEYNALLKRQKGHCALCARKPAQTRYGHLVVDHDHKTEKVRGLLCWLHNKALSDLGDTEAGLLRALAYIRRVK